MSRMTLQAQLLREGEEVPLEALSRLLASAEGIKVQAALVALGRAPAWQTIGQIGQHAMAGLLAIDPGEVLSTAWNKYRALAEYADPARTPPGRPAYVELIKHVATAILQPSIDVYVDQRKVTGFELTVEVRLTVEGACIRIESGKVTAIESGTCSGSVKLLAGEAKLFERDLMTFKLPGSIDVGSGMPIAA